MTPAKKTLTPTPSGFNDAWEDGDVATDTRTYQELVGSLLHLANFTRPDIAYSTGCLCRHMAKPARKAYERRQAPPEVR